MSQASRRKKRLLIGGVAAVALLLVTAVPGMAAKSTKTFGMEVTTNAPPSSGWTLQSPANSQPAATSIHAATQGTTTQFYAYLVNTTPGNSNPNSFQITAPGGYTIVNDSSHRPSVLSNNLNSGLVITTDSGNLYVQGLDPLKSFASSGQYDTVVFWATVKTSSTCGTGAADTWNATGYTGTNLSGDTFSQNEGDARTYASLTCSISFSPSTPDGLVNTDVTATVQTSPSTSGASITFSVTGKPSGATVKIDGAQRTNDTYTDTTDGSGKAQFTISGDTIGTYDLSADGGTYFGTATDSIYLFEGTLDCNQTVTTTGASVTRLPNPDGSTCTLKDYSLDRGTTSDGSTTYDTLTFLASGDQHAAYNLSLTWAPVSNTYPTATHVTQTDVTATGIGSFHDIEWCGGTTASPTMPAGEAICVTSQSWAAVGSDQIQLTETYYALYDLTLRSRY